MLHIPNRTMGSMGRLKLFPSNFAEEAMCTPELKALAKTAFDRLSLVGFFSPTAKELQGFEIGVASTADPWENPRLPSTIFYRVTVTQQPIPLVVITRRFLIKGKKFDHTRCREPFMAFDGTQIISGKAGRAVYPDQFRGILIELVDNYNKYKPQLR